MPDTFLLSQEAKLKINFGCSNMYRNNMNRPISYLLYNGHKTTLFLSLLVSVAVRPSGIILAWNECPTLLISAAHVLVYT